MSVLVIVLVKLRPRSHVKSCFLMYNQGKLVFGTQSKLGEGGTNRLSDTDLRDPRSALVLHRRVPAFGSLPSLCCGRYSCHQECPLRNPHYRPPKKTCLPKTKSGGIYRPSFSSMRFRTLGSIWASTILSRSCCSPLIFQIHVAWL